MYKKESHLRLFWKSLHMLPELVKDKHVIVTFVDYTKAFDVTSQEILFDKLYNIGVRGVLCFKSYLSERKLM
jgi:hypothetical protein